MGWKTKAGTIAGSLLRKHKTKLAATLRLLDFSSSTSDICRIFSIPTSQRFAQTARMERH